MKAISIRAPWWWLILYGDKRLENRPRRTSYRGPILNPHQQVVEARRGRADDH